MSALKRKLLDMVESEEEDNEYQLDETSDEDLDDLIDHLYEDSRDEETSEDELNGPGAPNQMITYTNLPDQIVRGGRYIRHFIHQEHMTSKASKDRAEVIRERQIQGPSEELLRSIYMLTAHRYYDVQNVPQQDLFRRSALFALGILVEEMSKHAARKEADTDSNKRDKSRAGDNNDKGTRANHDRTTPAKTRKR